MPNRMRPRGYSALWRSGGLPNNERLDFGPLDDDDLKILAELELDPYYV